MAYIRTFFNKLNNFPKPVKAMVFYTIMVFMQSGILLITTPIFTRILSTNEYGITTLYNSWYNIFSIFVTLNLSSGVYNNALLDYKDKDKVTAKFLGLSMTSAILYMIAYILLKNLLVNLIDLSPILVTFMMINFFVVPAWNFIINLNKFDYKYWIPFLVSIIIFILNPIFGILGIKLFPNDKAIAKVISCNLPMVVTGFISTIVVFVKGKSFFDKDVWKYALKFNIPLIPHYLANMILTQSDRIMIGRICGETYAGIYSIGYMISNLINGVFSAINSAWTPFVYKNLKSNNINKISSNTNILVIFIAFICIGVTLIAPEAIKILATQEYYIAMWVIPPIAIGMYFSFIYTLFGKIEFYHKKNIFIMGATSCAAILNIILNAIFIPKYGFVAAGYTTAVGYLVLAVAHYIFMKRITQENIYDIKFILNISILVTIIILSIMFLYNYWIIRYVIILITVVILLINYKKIINFYKKCMYKI